MQLSIVSYNGDTTINDGSNFQAFFPSGSVELSPTGTPIFVDRVGFSPVFVYKGRSVRALPIRLLLLGTVHSQLDTLKRLFNTYDDTLRTLIVADTANGNKQWYVQCTTVSFSERDGQEVVINLAVPDPIWYSNTQTTDSWSITTSGSTHNIVTTGTYPVEPIFELTPTTAKTGNLRYRRTVLVYNQLGSSLPNYPIDITNGGLNTAALIADTSVSNLLNGAVTSTATTWTVDTAVGGGLPASGGLAYVDTEQISYVSNTGTQLTGVVRGVNGTVAAAHADNSVVTRSKVDANGSDFVVFVDGALSNWWFGTGTAGFNQTATKTWIKIDLSPGQSMTVAAISTTDTSITLQNTNANISTIKNLAPSGAALIDSEVVTWTSKDVPARQLLGVSRGARGTTAASHTAGVTAIWIEHAIEIAYGDPNREARVMDNTYKPIFIASTSGNTNTSWTYTGGNFSSSSGKRPGEWKPSLISSVASASVRQTEYYTATQHTFADPSTAIGLSIGAYQPSSKWKADNAKLTWVWSSPTGLTDITFNGSKYRVGTKWPAKMALQKSTDGVTYTDVWNQASPGSASSWTAFTGSPTSLSGTFYYVRLYAAGTLSASASAEGSIEGTTVVVTLPSGAVPSVTINAERTSVYEFAATITNTNSGEYITVSWVMQIGQTLRIDCLNHAVTLVDDNSDAYGALDWSTVRKDWLNLAPNATITLRFNDTGTGNVTFVTKLRDRNH